MNHLAYLHTIGFSQSNLATVFSKRKDYDVYYKSFTRADLEMLHMKDDRIERILKNRENIQTKKLDETLEKHDVRLVSIHDTEYPSLLRNISHPPFLLYVRGTLRDTTDLISVVGSRRNTKYSEIALEKIIPSLISHGYGIVSGGAFGVDALAHQITLAHGGYTIAVVGTGIDLVYPAQNKALFESIISTGGAIVSAFPIGMKAEQYHFPIRNEFVAGMTRGVIIAEAGEKSGTLITARLALENNRDVFVIPGDINRPNSIGANNLIRDGLGKLVTSAEDILNEYHLQMQLLVSEPEKKKLHFDDDLERQIYETIENEPCDASALALTLDEDASVILYRCSMLEIKGYIRLDVGGVYTIN